MLPKLEKVGLGWATFQVLRRTNASLSRKAKVDDKAAADQRHASALIWIIIWKAVGFLWET